MHEYGVQTGNALYRRFQRLEGQGACMNRVNSNQVLRKQDAHWGNPSMDLPLFSYHRAEGFEIFDGIDCSGAQGL